MAACSLITLSAKKVANCCAADAVVDVEMFGDDGVAERWRRVLTVFQSIRGLEQLDVMRLEW